MPSATTAVDNAASKTYVGAPVPFEAESAGSLVGTCHAILDLFPDDAALIPIEVVGELDTIAALYRIPADAGIVKYMQGCYPSPRKYR